MRALSCAACVLAGCSLVTPFDLSPLARDGAADVAVEGVPETGAEEADATVEAGDVFYAPGPVTLVVDEIEVVNERICDLDGDGLEDNAFAALGDAEFALVSMALTAMTEGTLGDQGRRFIAHFPWIDDLTGPDDGEAPFILFQGSDTDEPFDPDDDFSGTEPFYAHWESLDACGEPRFHFPDCSIEGGRLTATAEGELVLGYDYPIVTRGVLASGIVGPGGAAMDVDVCAYSLARDLATVEAPGGVGGLSFLELLVSGAASLGVTVPGVDLDVDLDGDGLERFELDDDGHIATCIDGDLTPIDGAGCWEDERIADGLSITLRLGAVPARFAGPDPGWEIRVEGECDSPPETSLWDPS